MKYPNINCDSSDLLGRVLTQSWVPPQAEVVKASMRDSALWQSSYVGQLVVDEFFDDWLGVKVEAVAFRGFLQPHVDRYYRDSMLMMVPVDVPHPGHLFFETFMEGEVLRIPILNGRAFLFDPNTLHWVKNDTLSFLASCIAVQYVIPKSTYREKVTEILDTVGGENR